MFLALCSYWLIAMYVSEKKFNVGLFDSARRTVTQSHVDGCIATSSEKLKKKAETKWL